ncbi:MAG TPA: alpha/beta fold hydrolase, partial [Ramlibacter sp.]|nr:alpha/beta fold hydrolase [Ramlibacter sp.]
MIETFQQELPHGITLSCRAAGERGAPVLMFLHGFPEAAFVWDELLEHFATRGYRCVAPNLRGFEKSSQPGDVEQYRAKYIMQDIAALIGIEGSPLECLIAHDWGGAIAWNIANQRADLTKRLMIINSPHPGTFLRELQHSPKQQKASAYMNFLIRPDAEQLLREGDYRRLFGFFREHGGEKWLDDSVKQQYR